MTRWHLFLFLAWSLGHFCLVVLCVNISHSFGLRGRRIDAATFSGVAIAGVCSLVLAVWAWSTPPDRWPLPLKFYCGFCSTVALILLPLATWLRWRRALPSNVRGEVPTNLIQTNLEANVGSGKDAWLLRMVGNQSLRPCLQEWELTLPGLPEAFDGLSILHLTDLHMAACYAPAFFKQVVEAATSDPADLVVLTGDVVEDEMAIDWIVPVLAQVKGRLGQFAILGNHDLRHDPARVIFELARAGFVDVDGRWLQVSDQENGGRLLLGGTSAPWGPRLNPPEACERDLTVVLSHSPDQFFRVGRWNEVDLMLCGHNHGGQVRLPLVGPLVMPSRFSRLFDHGFFQRRSLLMYVSRGLGAKFPLRWNCSPEITRFVLRSTVADTNPRTQTARASLADCAV